ncbi:selina-4(15),7(11)-diene synthase [Streptomyces sp. SCSIO 30461]|uniref:selina-4(15),7(11)-diene synthase n=1 Tax=Streptomyces sp. SCSIO 30461 TaxID=3118085 RepID=UPI0030D5268F
MGPELSVPPLFSPIAPAIHPNHSGIDVQTAAWAETFRIGSAELRDELAGRSFGSLCARILPEGSEQVVSVLSDFMLWLAAVDEVPDRPGRDGADDAVGLLHRLIRVAQNPEAPMMDDDPLAAGLRDLRLRIDRFGTAGQSARWSDALREYFFSVVWEAAHRRAGTLPTLGDYTLMRLYNGATSVMLPLLEMGHAYELQPHERDHPSVRAAAESASFVTTWDRDVFSYHRERLGTGAEASHLNVVRVLEQQHGLAPEDALKLAVRQRDRVMMLFLRLSGSLAERGSPQLRQYLRGLACYIRGAQDWGLGSRPELLSVSTFTDTPADDGHEPLDIPAIAWWWELAARPSHAS